MTRKSSRAPAGNRNGSSQLRVDTSPPPTHTPSHNTLPPSPLTNPTKLRQDNQRTPAVDSDDSPKILPTRLRQNSFNSSSTGALHTKSTSSLFTGNTRKYSTLTAESNGSTYFAPIAPSIAPSATSYHGDELKQGPTSSMTTVKSNSSRIVALFTLPARLFSYIENKIPLCAKLLFLIVPLLFVVICLGLYLCLDGLVSLSASSQAGNLAWLDNHLSHLKIRVEEERTIVTTTIQINSTAFQNRCHYYFDATDGEFGELRERSTSLSEVANQQYLKLRNLLSQMPEQRHSLIFDYPPTSTGKTSALIAAIAFYDSISSVMDDLSATISMDVQSELGLSASLAGMMQEKDDILKLQSVWATKASMLSLIMSLGSWDSSGAGNGKYFSWALYHQQNALEQDLLVRVKNAMSEKRWNQLSAKYAPVRDPLYVVENELLKMSNFDNVTGDSLQWIHDTSAIISTLQSEEQLLFQNIMDGNNSMYSAMLAQTLIMVILFVIFVPCIIVFSLLFCLSIYRPVIEQRRSLITALDIADSIMDLRFDAPGVILLKQKPESQCTPLERAFKRILENFQSFIPYVPRHLLVRSEEEDQIAEKNRLPHADSTSNVSSHSSFRRSLSRTQSKATTLSKNSSGSRLRSNVSSNSSRRRERSYSTIKKREVSIMVVDLNDFCRSTFQMDFEHLQKVYAEYLTLISQLLKLTNGLMHSFSGGIFICSWGSVGAKQFELVWKAAKTALQIAEFTKSDSQRFPFSVRIGISTGICAIGELGNAEQRGLQVIGSPLTVALALAKLAKQYNCGILTDFPTYKEATFNCDMQQRDVVSFSKIGSSASLRGDIFQLVADKQVVDAEWMYSMADSTNKDTFDSFNKAWQSVLQGNFEEAKKQLQKFVSVQQEKHSDEKEKTEDSSHDQKTDQDIPSEGNLPAISLLNRIIEHGLEDPTYRYAAECLQYKIENNCK